MKYLVIAPHNDDEVLGVGGTIAKAAHEGHEIHVCEITSVADKDFLAVIMDEAKNAHKVLGVKESHFLHLPVVELKGMKVTDINRAFLTKIKEIMPDIVFIPHKGDMHRDHYETALASLVALRPVELPSLKEIYAYETLSETEWNIPSVDNLFIPNVYNDISDYIEIKLEAMSCYKTQLNDFPNPRSLRTIRSLSEVRGSTICRNNAEAFMLIRKIGI